MSEKTKCPWFRFHPLTVILAFILASAFIQNIVWTCCQHDNSPNSKENFIIESFKCTVFVIAVVAVCESVLRRGTARKTCFQFHFATAVFTFILTSILIGNIARTYCDLRDNSEKSDDKRIQLIMDKVKEQKFKSLCLTSTVLLIATTIACESIVRRREARKT